MIHSRILCWLRNRNSDTESDGRYFKSIARGVHKTIRRGAKTPNTDSGAFSGKRRWRQANLVFFLFKTAFSRNISKSQAHSFFGAWSLLLVHIEVYVTWFLKQLDHEVADLGQWPFPMADSMVHGVNRPSVTFSTALVANLVSLVIVLTMFLELRLASIVSVTNPGNALHQEPSGDSCCVVPGIVVP
jgi:hypothetical protein